MAKVTESNKLYFYQLFSAEIGVGKQVRIDRVSEVLEAADVLLEDVECETVDELVVELAEFIKLTVFKGGRRFVTVLSSEEYDLAIRRAEELAADKKAAASAGKAWKHGRASKVPRPAKPRHKRRKAPAHMAPAPAQAEPKTKTQTEAASQEVPAVQAEPVAPAEPVMQEHEETIATAETVAPAPSPQQPAAPEAVGMAQHTAVPHEQPEHDQQDRHAATPAHMNEHVDEQAANRAEGTSSPSSRVGEPTSEMVTTAASVCEPDEECVIAPEPEPEPAPELEPEPAPIVEVEPAASDQPLPEPGPSINLTITFDPSESPDHESPQEDEVAGEPDDTAPQPQEDMQAQAGAQPQANLHTTETEPSSKPPRQRAHTIEWPQRISDEVFCPDACLLNLYQVLPPTIGILDALDEGWEFAREAGTLEGTRTRITFPLSRRIEGNPPIEVTIARASRIPSNKHWQLETVDTGLE